MGFLSESGNFEERFLVKRIKPIAVLLINFFLLTRHLSDSTKTTKTLVHPKLYISSTINSLGRGLLFGQRPTACKGWAVWTCKMQGWVAQELHLLDYSIS